LGVNPASFIESKRAYCGRSPSPRGEEKSAEVIVVVETSSKKKEKFEKVSRNDEGLNY
jgi:hypothetical protein